ncbi:HEXXH motif-containing putative peptide modification protein [Streptomyces sp. NPDC006446]|uniref:aKG-HExxH-type peptide beta-hydroxylase n=1 Tax=Streptomyces sp. NPDC006446 TaxID=3154301 RepID=UPI0033AD45B0
MSTVSKPAAVGPLPVSELDELLVTYPFGNSEYVTSEMHRCYKRRLASISERVPLARDVLEALDRADPYVLYRVMGDTAFRCAVQHLHVQIEDEIPYGMPPERCHEILKGSLQSLKGKVPGLIGSALSDRVGGEPFHGWVWREDCPETIFTEAFRSIVDDHYGLTLHTPSSDELTALAEAVRLLGEVLPNISRSVLSHTHLVAVFAPTGQWATTRSSSEFRISGTIFLSQRTLSNVWALAEHILHESLHQQLYDIRAGHSLLAPDFARADAPLVHSLWNMPDSTRGNYWDIHRTLAAFHVYVHLALFARAAREPAEGKQYTARYGPAQMVGPNTALARARYLGDQLRQQGWAELGPAGRQIVDWLHSVLEVVDADPIVQGSFVHLLLDRYWRESSMVRSLAAVQTVDTELLPQFSRLLQEELDCARSVLGTLGYDLTSFDEALGSFGSEESFERFASVRGLIAETLLRACPERYVLSSSHAADDRVRRMVEESSETLRKLLGR